MPGEEQIKPQNKVEYSGLKNLCVGAANLHIL